MIAAGKPDVRVLEERHMISVMLYLLEHDGCRKTEIYDAVAHSPRLPEKLDILQANGLISMEVIHQRAIFIHLTDRGRMVARHLSDMEDLFKQDAS